MVPAKNVTGVCEMPVVKRAAVWTTVTITEASDDVFNGLMRAGALTRFC